MFSRKPPRRSVEYQHESILRPLIKDCYGIPIRVFESRLNDVIAAERDPGDGNMHIASLGDSGKWSVCFICPDHRRIIVSAVWPSALRSVTRDFKFMGSIWNNPVRSPVPASYNHRIQFVHSHWDLIEAAKTLVDSSPLPNWAREEIDDIDFAYTAYLGKTDVETSTVDQDRHAHEREDVVDRVHVLVLRVLFDAYRRN